MTSVTAHDSESAARREAECVYHHHLPKQSLTQYDSTHPPSQLFFNYRIDPNPSF
ncbi:hypothetical protein PGTUg99_018402 [Puccinia graminis f. sp. tritici]|uniref:Uncharacterized protein n=1 Tax=Puccinia graminis f. sp. tritici TaxID=56615 RepID=A0A5B0LWF1_PUCGR|nr:hypothetical protein PGTUg99_018402 [Puccinia graminis f. sp. tritici]